MVEEGILVEGRGIWVGVIAEKKVLNRVVLSLRREEIFSKLGVREKIGLSHPLLESIKEDLTSYFTADKVDFSTYPLKMDLSPVAKRVLGVVRKIPYGQVRTYKWVARQVRCRGYRAVGQILSINPFPIIIPCHRVVRSDGSLGGFSAGVEIKRKLLEIEGVIV